MIIRLDDLRGPEVRALLEAHLRHMHTLSPPESVHALDLDRLRRPEIRFYTAWDGDQLAGCGALKDLGGGEGEIKSMRTADSHRGRGVGTAVLTHLLNVARASGWRRLNLETGPADRFGAAHRLYEAFGFTVCEPFADYRLDPFSVFMTLPLRPPFTTDLLDTLARACAGMSLPRVRALHLPPVPWTQTRSGEFTALELEDGSLGLACVLLNDTLAALASGDRPTSVVGADPLALARRWIDQPGVERTLAFAAVNALTRHLFDRAGFAPPDAADSIGELDPQPGDHVGMVGLFPPLVKRVTACGARLTVIERRDALVGDFPAFRCTLDPAALADCNKVLSTSTVLLNDTLDEVLAHARHASRIAMIGPGAACLPDPLFARGVGLVGGLWVEDRAGLINCLRQGTPWGRHTRKFALTPALYPGAQALRRAGGR